MKDQSGDANEMMPQTEPVEPRPVQRMVRRLVGYNTDSESPEDFCEECMDTGWGGDHGPGWRGNNEIGPCACNPKLRARRNIARQNVKPPNSSSTK